MSTAMAKGQATNLAAADARKNNRESDVKYIYQRHVFWLTVCEALQGSDLEMIQEVINNKDFDKVIKQLTEVLK